MSAPYQAFRCADGYITVGAANQRTFEKLAQVLGHPEWPADPRFATDTTRVAHRERAGRRPSNARRPPPPAAEWLERLDAAGIPCGPILDYAEAFDAPQARAREMSRRSRPPGARPHAHARHAHQDVGDAARPERRAPLLGEHTAEVLTALGYSAAAIARMRGDAGAP